MVELEREVERAETGDLIHHPEPETVAQGMLSLMLQLTALVLTTTRVAVVSTTILPLNVDRKKILLLPTT